MEDNPILWKSIVPFCMCLDMVSTQFLWGLILLNFIITSLCKSSMCIHLQPQGVVRAPSVAEIAFVILKQMTYFLSKSMAVS